MIKRIEFTLNLDDPKDAAIYRALSPLRFRRAGVVIRQALDQHLNSQPQQIRPHQPKDGKHEQA